MKLLVVISVLAVVYCVRESESFKIIKKIKDFLHPTEASVTSTTDHPIIPSYENQHGQRESDWSSEERESSTKKIKSKQPDEDTSSQSSEHNEGSFANSKNTYNSVKPDKTKPYPEGSFNSNTFTTQPSNYNSGYGSNKEKYPSRSKESYPGQSSFSGNFGNQEVTSTTTVSYDFGGQNQPDRGLNSENTRSSTESSYNRENYPNNNEGNYTGQSSFSGNFGNQEVTSTTTMSYDFGGQNQPDHGTNNQNTRSTTENSYNGENYPNKNEGSYPGQSSFSDNFGNQEVKSTTTISYDFGGQSQPGVYNQNPQSTTENNNGVYNTPEQSPSFGGVSKDDQTSQNNFQVSWNNSDTAGQSTTTENYVGSLGQNNDDQSSVFSNFNNINPQTTTSRSVYSSNNNYNNPEQSFGSVSDNLRPSTSTETYGGSQNQNYDGQSSITGSGSSAKTQTSTPRTDYSYNSFDKPEQSPSYSHSNGAVSSTTPTYYNTNMNEIESGQSSGNSYNPRPDTPDSSRPSTSYGKPGSSVSGGNQQKTTSGSRPFSSTAKMNQTKQQDNSEGVILFPDDPLLDPTPETERVFGEHDSNFKVIKEHFNSSPAPVGVEEGRTVIGAAPRKCGVGQTLDPKKNQCRTLSRK